MSGFAPPQNEGATPAKSDPNENSKTEHIESCNHPHPQVQARIVRLPASDCDLLSGLWQIAAWYGLTVGQVRAKVACGEIPVFYLPGKSTVFALKSRQLERSRRAEENYVDRKSVR